MERQENDSIAPSRRTLITGTGTGIFAALAGQVALAQDPPSASNSGAAPLEIAQNPVTEYPHPPFRKQPQPWPGLDIKMDPRPDNGAKTYRGSGRLAGRKALITGGDSGIGSAVTIAFAREGAEVVFNHLPAEEPDANQVIQAIQSSGGKVHHIPGDIRTEAFCRSLVDEAVNRLGGLDILVNNAGYQRTQPSIAEVTTQQFDDTFKTNIYAMFWITKAAMPHLRAGSAIVNTASGEALNPSETLLDYSATKGAIVAFTKSLAKQVAKQGIRVNAVAPGPVWTPLQVSGGATEDKVAKFGETTPYGRPAQPVELAPVYVLLASQEASFTTGQLYEVSDAHT